MIIKDGKNIEIQSKGASLQSTGMEISSEDMGFLMSMMSDIYQDAPGSIIREWVSNSFDSHTEAGKNDPILVRLYKEDNNYFFSVEDFGVGIDQNVIDNIISKYGKSTKRNSSTQLGAFGIGAKSGLAYNKYFTIIGRKNGTEGMWIMREGEEKNEIDTVYNNLKLEENVSNGAKFILQLKGWSDATQFSRKIRQQLCYFKGVYVEDCISDFDNNFSIYENDMFKISEMCSDSSMHLCLADVYYPIDWEKLGISNIYLPLGIKLSLDDGVFPTPSREGVKYTSSSKDIILERIKNIANWAVTQYNEKNTHFTNWISAEGALSSNSKHIKIAEKEYNIDSIIKYSDVKCNEITIDGYESKYLSFLYKRKYKIFSNFKKVGEIEYGKYSSKSNKHKSIINYDAENIGLVSAPPTGNNREYLKSENDRIYLFREGERKLKGIKFTDYPDKYWCDALGLRLFDKSEWRTLIQHAIKIVDEHRKIWKKYLTIQIPQAWLDGRKKKREYNNNYQGLCKEEGDITIAFPSLSHLTSNYTYKKQAVPTERNFKKLIIYSDQSNINTLRKLEYYFRNSINCRNIGTAIIGPREAKKISDNQHYVEIKKFMETRAFRKLATAMKAKKVYQDMKTINTLSNLEDIFPLVSKEYQVNMSKFKKYIDDANNLSVDDDQLLSDMLKIAEKNNLYDFEMLSHINKASKKLDEMWFVKFLNIPEERYDWEDQDEYISRTKEIRKVFHQMALFNKLYNNQFENWTICPPVELEHEVKVQEEELIAEGAI